MTDLTALARRVEQHAEAGNPFVTLRTAELSALLRVAMGAVPDAVPWAEIDELHASSSRDGAQKYLVNRLDLRAVVDFARACAGLAAAKPTNGDHR